MKERVLIVAAHPDDEVLGAGGAMARHAAKGDEVSVLILGEGVTSRFDTREEGLSKGAADLERLGVQMKEAHCILGVSRTEWVRLPDNRFDSIPLLEVVKVVERLKREVIPTVVYTHHGGDLNVDHRVTLDAVVTAFRPTPTEKVQRILCFEVLSSTEWNVPVPDRAFLPNIFIEVEPFLETKVKAMACYGSELSEYPHPRSLEALRQNARLWGVKTGLKAVEAFMLVRERIL